MCVKHVAANKKKKKPEAKVFLEGVNSENENKIFTWYHIMNMLEFNFNIALTVFLYSQEITEKIQIKIYKKNLHLIPIQLTLYS